MRIRRSLLRKNVLLSTSIIFVLILSLSGVSYLRSSTAIKNEIVQQLQATFRATQGAIESKQENLADQVYFMSHLSVVAEGEDRAAIISVLEDYGHQNKDIVEHVFITDVDGIVIYDNVAGQLVGTDLSDRAYFTASKQGTAVWSEVLPSKFSGKSIQVVAAPIYSEYGNYIGILGATIDYQVITDIVYDVTIGEKGYAYLIDQDGTIIAHPTEDMIGKKLAELGIPELNEAVESMVAGEEDQVHYTYNGIAKLNIYGPVGGVWSLSINAVDDEYLSPIKKMQIEQAILGLVFFLLGAIIIGYSSYLMIKKIKNVAHIMDLAGKGDLSVSVANKLGRNGDELDQMSAGLNEMIANLNNTIKLITHVAIELSGASQQLSASSEENRAASEEVAMNMGQIAEGSQMQADQLEQTNDLFKVIEDQVRRSSDLALDMEKHASEVKQVTSSGNQMMQETKDQMERIKVTSIQTVDVMNMLDTRSKEIGQINEVILGIAEQTNLLALNAAIEAARAGEQGKGFAVVADEIRKLAAQSEESVKNIEALIGDVQKDIQNAGKLIREEDQMVEKGIEAVSNSSMSFRTIKEKIEAIGANINEVTQGVEATFSATNNCTRSMEKIVAVVHEASATTQTVNASAEEQTAVSEEMAASAMMLADLAERLTREVDVFKI